MIRYAHYHGFFSMFNPGLILPDVGALITQGAQRIYAEGWKLLGGEIQLFDDQLPFCC